MSDSRGERAKRRRAEWQAEVVEVGASKGLLYEQLTPEERILALARLNWRAWLAAGGGELPPLPRSQWPGEIFELRRG